MSVVIKMKKNIVMFLLFFSTAVQAEVADSFFISPLKAHKLMKKGWLGLDIRPEEEYKKSHIPGTININKRLIGEKTFLKNKKLILIDSGEDDQSLVTLFEDLAFKKFKSVIVKGGINSWYLSHRKVTGLPENKETLLKINFLKFHKASKNKSAILIDNESFKNKSIDGILFFLTRDDFKEPDKIIRMLEREKKYIDKIFFLTRSENSSIINKLKSKEFKTIFEVSGTPEQYLEWLKIINKKEIKIENQGYNCIPCLKNKIKNKHL